MLVLSFLVLALDHDEVVDGFDANFVRSKLLNVQIDLEAFFVDSG